MLTTVQADLFRAHVRDLLEVGHCQAPVWISPSTEYMNMGSQQPPEKGGGGGQGLTGVESDSKPICVWQFHSPALI